MPKVLRGPLIVLVIMLIFFPDVRAMLLSVGGVILGGIVGALLGLFLLFGTGNRHR